MLPNSFIKTNINKLLANLIANKFSDTCYNIRLVCSYEAHLEINGQFHMLSSKSTPVTKIMPNQM